MQTVIIMRGLPGSGKSAFTRQLLEDSPGKYKRINRDELRAMFDNGRRDRDNEKFVKKIRDLLLIEALQAGKSVILDDTNLSSKNITRIRQLVGEYIKSSEKQVQVQIKEMETSLAACLERDSRREHPVGEKVIREMQRQFFPAEERYVRQDNSLPKAIICDLDGTLALLNGRDPYVADRCGEDLLNEPVANVLKQYKSLGYSVLLLSGRYATYRKTTVDWLGRHGIAFDVLIMRAADDQRKDSIVKREFFEQHIQGKYYIEFILDDRNQVVNMWRDELRLPCLQVYYGDF